MTEALSELWNGHEKPQKRSSPKFKISILVKATAKIDVFDSLQLLHPALHRIYNNLQQGLRPLAAGSVGRTNWMGRGVAVLENKLGGLARDSFDTVNRSRA